VAEEPIVTEPVVTPPENSTIRDMRAKVEESTRAAKAAADEAAQLKAQLDAIEREKMSEQEKLRADLALAQEKAKELDTVRDEHGRFASAFENLYNEALSQVPEDKRADVERLTSQGSWADRYQALQSASKLIGTTGVSVPRIQPTSPSVVTDPQVTPPTKTNLDVAKSGGVFGIPDIREVQYRKATKLPQGE